MRPMVPKTTKPIPRRSLERRGVRLSVTGAPCITVDKIPEVGHLEIPLGSRVEGMRISKMLVLRMLFFSVHGQSTKVQGRSLGGELGNGVLGGESVRQRCPFLLLLWFGKDPKRAKLKPSRPPEAEIYR